MKFLRKLKNDKTAAIHSLWWAIIVLLVIYGIMAVLNVHQKLTLRNQLQGQADLAATSALVYASSQPETWDEGLVLDESLAIRKFKQIINETTRNNNAIDRVIIQRVNVYDQSNLPGRLGNLAISTDSENGDRKQYFLEAILSIEFPANRLFDLVSNVGFRYYDIVKGREDSVSEVDTPEDGMSVIPIRSLGRIVLR